MGRGKYMIREYKAGQVVEKSKFWVPEQTKRRSPKRASSTHRKQDQNERDAIKRLARSINCNFVHGDLWITLKLDTAGYKAVQDKAGAWETDVEFLNAVRKELKHQAELFLRRLSRAIEKDGLTLKYIMVISDMSGKTGEVVRPHCHILMTRVAFELCERQWKLGTVDYQILKDQPDYTPLAVYMLRQVRRQPDEKKWTPSRNLDKPVITETVVEDAGPLVTPRGALSLAQGEYDIETGSHYIRYVPKRFLFQKKNTAGTGTKPNASNKSVSGVNSFRPSSVSGNGTGGGA